MQANDEFRVEDGCGALLLCALCKREVRSGEQHQCNQEKENNEKAKIKKIEWSSRTPFPL